MEQVTRSAQQPLHRTGAFSRAGRTGLVGVQGAIPRIHHPQARPGVPLLGPHLPTTVLLF